tara:strand:- start:452 stop:598 length:147 start_codon:yes stop_codon:yes gene_type:complete
MNIYNINETQLKAINVLIRTLQEGINRNAFSCKEIESIKKVIEILNRT